MFLFATSQVIAASQARQGKPHGKSHGKAHARAARSGNGLFSRVLDALVVSRMNRAKIEIEYQRRLREGSAK
jgi:hypothetical protein